jgi:DNA-binding CsgD family transcriptional regulator
MTNRQFDPDLLTEKEVEAMLLVADNRSSKQIARALSISPSAVDKRVESVRTKLGGIPRSDAARLVKMHCKGLPCSPITVPESPRTRFDRPGVSEETRATFQDSGTYFQKVPWSRRLDFLDPAPGFRPDQLSKVRRISIIGDLTFKTALVLLVMLGVASGIEEAFFS